MSSSLEPSREELEGWIRACSAFVVDHIGALGSMPSWDTEEAAAVVDSLREPVPEGGRALAEILARLGPAIRKSFNTAGPGYMAFIPGGGVPSAGPADFGAVLAHPDRTGGPGGPAVARIEATVVEWLAGLMGYPPGAGGILTSGGSLSHLTAIVAARTARLPEGDLARGTIYYSRETHTSVPKAARIAGLSAR